MGTNTNQWTQLSAVAVFAYMISVALYTFFLKRRNLKGDHVAGAVLMRYPLGWHLFAWSMFILPLGGLGYLVWKFPPHKTEDVISLIVLLFGFGGATAAMLVQVIGVAYELRPDGLVRVTPWSPRCFLPWSLVTEVRYSDLMTGWKVRTGNGDSAWVWLALSGTGAFARAVLEKVPAQAIARDARTQATLNCQLGAGH
jgi:hypothetical protein